MFLGHWLVLFVLVLEGKGFPIDTLKNPKIPPSQVLDFMTKYGYLEEDDGHSGALYTEEGIAETIKIVQRFGALEETGILDNATLQLMQSPRCGVPDIIRRKRRRRFVIGSKGWKKRIITYFIANWSPKLGEYTVMKNIQLALDAWGKYGHLKFQRINSPGADIVVAFGSGYHGDRYPFDGQGNVLAHAFFPYEDSSFGGDIHFDADEDWKDKENEDEDGTDFSTVALHELGHSLGLSHSVVHSSVMFPYYKGSSSTSKFQLGYDDILGMYELYIRRNVDSDEDIDENYETTTAETTTERFSVTYPTTTITTTTTTTATPMTTKTTQLTTQPSPTQNTTFSTTYEGDVESVDDHKTHDPNHNIPSTNSPSLPNICNGYFDSVATLREEIFIFKEQYVWRLKKISQIEPGYPITIHQMFPQLPKSIKQIDAAYERPDGFIVLFTGETYWVYDGHNFVENSPKPLSEYGLPSGIDKIDAVQNWARNGKTYFYKHDRFWRYNETSKTMDEGYPKHMERWRGVPHDLDAATTWKGITYFFKAELYWKFDNDWVIVTEQSPLPAPQIWLSCPEDYINIFNQDY